MLHFTFFVVVQETIFVSDFIFCWTIRAVMYFHGTVGFTTGAAFSGFWWMRLSNTPQRGGNAPNAFWIVFLLKDNLLLKVSLSTCNRNLVNSKRNISMFPIYCTYAVWQQSFAELM